MKFPKPKKLTKNEYPDLLTPQPELFKELINEKNEYPDLLTPQPELFKELINEIIYPKEGSARE